MLYDYEEGVDSQLAAEMDGLELELNFQHAAAKSDRFSRLLFPRNFPGANSKERLSYLYSITEEVPGEYSKEGNSNKGNLCVFFYDF